MTHRDRNATPEADAIARDEGELAAFFEAARASEPAPPIAFLNAVLADAATVAAERAPAPPQPRPSRTDAAPWLRPFGGWIGAAALAGCAAAGFVAGTLGTGSELAAMVLASEASGFDSDSESVLLFFDLDAAEG